MTSVPMFYITLNSVWGTRRYERPMGWNQGLSSHSLFLCNADRVKDDRITDVNPQECILVKYKSVMLGKLSAKKWSKRSKKLFPHESCFQIDH